MKSKKFDGTTKPKKVTKSTKTKKARKSRKSRKSKKMTTSSFTTLSEPVSTTDTIWNDSRIEWQVNGVPHKEDGPAVIHPNFNAWFINGINHRTDGPAISSTTSMTWCISGFLSRTDGPAIEYHDDSIIEYWVDGKLHREDGPAIDYADGTQRWFLNGVEYTEEEYDIEVAKL